MVKAKLNVVKPYGYFVVRKSDNMKYVGIRYANVKLNLTPYEDFGKVYFTSGRLKKEFKKNPSNFYFKICRVFDSMDDMWEWEKRVVLRVYRKDDWANNGWSTNFGENPRIGSLISEGKNREDAYGETSVHRGARTLREWLFNTEEGRDDLAERSERMRRAWAEKTPEERAAWAKKRVDKMDFKAAAAKTKEKLLEVGEDGLTGFQRNARKASKKMLENGTLSKIGKDRNKTLDKKVGEMTEQEFQQFCEGKALCFQKGMMSRRLRYLNNRDSNSELS